MLDGGLRTALIRRTGDFAFHDVDAGLYILSVEARHFVFDHFLIEVHDEETKAPTVYPYIPGTPLLPKANVTLPHPVALLARRRNTYFVPRESFNLVGMFSNPMMMLMLFTGVMMFAMPSIMNSMDPETMQEAKQMQAKILGVQQAVQSGDFAALKQTVSGGDSSPGQQQQVAAKPKSQKSKRR